MSRNKVVIGGNISQDVARADNAQRGLTDAQAELTMIRRRIRTFYAAVTQVNFPASPPSWAEDWVEWLETGKILVLEAPEVVEIEATESELAAETAEIVFEDEILVGNPADEADAAEAQADMAAETPAA